MGLIDTHTFKTTTFSSKFWILTISCLFTRWTEVGIIYETTLSVVLEVIKKIWLEQYKKPIKSLSDNGKQFCSQKFGMFCKKQNIKHIKTSNYNPTCNGIVERTHQTIANVIRINKESEITLLPTLINKRLNYVANTESGLSPYEVINNSRKFDILKRNLSDRIRNMKNYYILTKNNRLEQRNARRIEYAYRIGDKVYLKNQRKGKIDDRWIGPLAIEKVDLKRQQVIINYNGTLTKENIKNIRPAFERE